MGQIAGYSAFLNAATSVEINVLNLVDAEVAKLEENLRGVSGQLIFKYGGMANGVGQMVSDIKGATRPKGLRVLRWRACGRSTCTPQCEANRSGQSTGPVQ